MAVAGRPLGQRLAGTFCPLNILSALLLLGGGLGMSRLLVAPRFGTIMLMAGLLVMIPASVWLVINPRLGALAVFVVSIVVIELKRVAWNVEVGILLEGVEALLAIGMALSIVYRRDSWRLSSPLTLPVLIYLSYQFVISFHPGLPSLINVVYALRDTVNVSVPFFAALYLIRDRRQVKLVLYLWLGASVILALYGLKQHFLGLNTWELAWISTSPTHRLYGEVRIFSTLGSADALGMHMAVSIVVALAVAFYPRDRRIRYGAVALIPLFVITNLYTLTRGAYLAMVVGAVVLGIITRNRSLLITLVVAGALAVAWCQMNQGSLLASRVLTMFSPEQDDSYMVRQDYIQQYMPTIVEHPFGHGPDTSGRQGGALLYQAGIDPNLVDSLAGVPTDNYYFRIALEDGWVGLLFFIGLLMSVYGIGLRTYFRARDPLVKWTAAALLSAYTAMAVSSMSNNYFSAVDLRLFFWFSVGVLSTLPAMDRQTRDQRAVQRITTRYPRLGGARRW